MAQLIEEPTRVARTSATIIDLILTNVPEKISHAGVIHAGISDHSLIYVVRKFNPLKRRPTIKKVRNFKHFSETEFISDLTNIPWQTIFTMNDPNLSWNKWKELFIRTLDKHAPVRHIRSGKYTTPWMTAEIRSAMRRRDYHKKKAIKLKSDSHWHNYKRLRNKVNKLIRETKSTFYINKISECAGTKDLKKCWSTINSLLGKQNKSNYISELKVGENVITDPNLIAEHFNTLSTLDFAPMRMIRQTKVEKIFSPTPTSIPKLIINLIFLPLKLIVSFAI